MDIITYLRNTSKTPLLLVIGALVALLGLLITLPAYAAPPTDFQTTLVTGDGLDGPSGFEFAPDGRIFILERTGKVKIVKDGQLLAQPFADLPSVASGDRGLIGIAFDPDFGISNHYVYFYYTGLDLINRLVRFDAAGDIGTNGPYLIFQTNSPSQELHVGGSIRFGSDGKMYFAVGDNGYPPNGQDLSNPHGKIHRINKDGTIPADNPFAGQPGKVASIWAYGFRNPWRFQFDSATNRLFGGDVGDFTWEEVNRIEKAKNYGWPLAEGMCEVNCDNLVNPIYAYNHDFESSAITGGPIYRANMFPSEYQGNLFFGDYAKGFIKRIQLDADGNSAGVFDFDTTAGSVVDMKVASDGSLYYITYYPGALHRVTYNTDSHLPIANASADVTKGTEPLTVNFSSAGSSDPDGDPITYEWDFGDGTTSTAASPTKVYPNKGVYTVKLRVSDGSGQAQASPVVIQVGIPPELTVSAPVEGALYRAGDTVTYNAHARDGAGLDIDDGAIKTEILLHHGTHVHPFLGPLQGRVGSFTVPTTGEASADTWFEIKVTATDTNGLSETKSVNVFPQKSQLTFTTQPPGLRLYLDGIPINAPHIIEGVEGFERELAAPPTATDASGNPYHFVGWSDGGAIRHFMTTPTDDTAYTAAYAPSPAFTGEYFDNPTLEGAPVLTRDDPQINFLWEGGSPDAQVPIENFSARWTKTQYFEAGRYKFVSATDDGVRLYIDGDLVMDGWQNQSDTVYTYIVDLAAGEHEIKMEYYEATGLASARLTIETTPDQATGFEAEYWNTPGSGAAPAIPTRTPDLARTETAIDHDWGGGSPGAPITNDHFVARWTRAIPLSGGAYDFTVTADDGVRLYIDGIRVIDKWGDQGPTAYTTNQILSSGLHTVVMEYYEHGGGALANFSYTKTGALPASSYTAEFWNMPGAGTAPSLPTRPADVTREDAMVDFAWDEGIPNEGISADNFGARWTKNVTLPAGVYRFSGMSDDGIRVFVDGQLLVDRWQDQNEGYFADVTLQSGEHEIKVEYYENTGGAGVKMIYSRIGDLPPDTGYSAEYFGNMDLDGAPLLTRNDASVDFGWGYGSPHASIPDDNFSARWTRTQHFAAGQYTFTTTTDDGVRLFVDGELVIDKWVDQSSTAYTALVSLDEGDHTIVMEYYENGGGAVARMGFERTGDIVVPPKFAGEYFTNATLSGTPAFTREDSTVDFDWGWGSPVYFLPDDNFSARWTRTQAMDAGTYRMSVTGDDGIRVFVDDQLVIDGWFDQSPTTYTADVPLTAGQHTIRIEYYEAGGQAVAQFSAIKL